MSTELQAMKELTETLYNAALKLGGVVDYMVTEGMPDAWRSESKSFDILFHCILKDLETRQPESECEATPSEPESTLTSTLTLNNEKEKGEYKIHCV